MQNRLFSTNDQSFLRTEIDFNTFINAVRTSDLAKVDKMLEARKNGYLLNIDHEIDGKCSNTALSISLKKGDIEMAAKLIRAGAKTSFTYKEWVADNNSGYPYGDFETKTLNILASCPFTDELMKKLMSPESTNYLTEATMANRP